jgi:uncharacterized protein YdeI (YjbR/CyaY-like superfamily)
MPEVQVAVEPVLAQEFELPPDLREALQANEQAWEHFQTFSGAYQHIRIAYIETARDRPDEFEKRLKNFLKKTEQGKQFGFGIDEYY